MPEFQLTINHGDGLHARPASQFVKTSQKFASKITVNYNGRSANGKSMLAILTLGVQQGAKITLDVEGEDAVNAIQSLTALVNNNFEE